MHVGPGDNGLELRQWVIDDDPARIAQVLGPWVASYEDDSQTDARLRRNGLRWVRVPLDELEPALIELGGAHTHVSTWLGQQMRWAPTFTYRVNEQGEALAVDGRVRRIADGALRLLCRSWTMQTLDGPSMYLELVPNFHRPSNVAADLFGPRPGAGERGHAVRGGQWYRTLSVQRKLEAGHAYVLTGESPQSTWTEAEAPVEEAARSDVIGPDAPAPVTFGEMLFRADGKPGKRTILVFIPRIPSGLNPPPLDHDANQHAHMPQGAQP